MKALENTVVSFKRGLDRREGIWFPKLEMIGEKQFGIKEEWEKLYGGELSVLCREKDAVRLYWVRNVRRNVA